MSVPEDTHLRVLAEKQPGGRWTLRVLEFAVTVEGASQEEAYAALQAAVLKHLQVAHHTGDVAAAIDSFDRATYERFRDALFAGQRAALTGDPTAGDAVALAMPLPSYAAISAEPAREVLDRDALPALVAAIKAWAGGDRLKLKRLVDMAGEA